MLLKYCNLINLIRMSLAVNHKHFHTPMFIDFGIPPVLINNMLCDHTRLHVYMYLQTTPFVFGCAVSVLNVGLNSIKFNM